MALILDEAWSKVDPAGAVAAGYHGVIGYVSEDTTGKNLTATDVQRLHAVGLDVGLVYEYDPKGALKGNAEGARDAGIAVRGAQALGAPAMVTLYTAIDFDARDTDMPALRAYVDAYTTVVNAHGYRAGVYGSYAVCWVLHRSGWRGMLWQTYAWSHGVWCEGLTVRQTRNGVHLAGADIDQDATQAVDWGQWPAVGTPGRIEGSNSVSIKSDNIIAALSEGDPTTVDETGKAIPVCPVQWRIRDEAWQTSVNAALSGLATAVARLGTVNGTLTDQEAADLHTIASVLKAPAA